VKKALAVSGAHVLVACALTACHSPPPRHPGDEFVEAIRFTGNKAFSDKSLREGLALSRVRRHGGAPDPYLVTVDGERIKGFYVRRGFLEVDVHSTVERKGDAVYVTYKIDEGPRATTRVVINGLPADPDLKLTTVRKALPLEDGKTFDYDVYDVAKEPLLGVLQDAGYAHARLDAKVIADRAHHQAVVMLSYDVGPKCHFGRVEVDGVSGDVADSVRARLAIKEGQQFSTAAIAETQRNLYDMKRFSNVRVLPDKSDGETVNVKVSVSESAPHEVALGGGVGMDPATYEVRGRAGYTVIGWPFPLTTTEVDLRPAYAMLRDQTGYEPRIRAMANVRRIDLFRPFMVGEIEGGYNYLTVEAYTSYGPRGRLGLESPIVSKRLMGRIGWEYQYLDFRHISPLIDPTLEHELGLDQSEKLGEYTQTIALDLRDSPIETRRGVYAEIRAAEGTPAAGGALTFTQITPELRMFYPVRNFVIAARARYGAIYGDIPVSERFYSGGSTTQRGFSERRLAPTVVGMLPDESGMTSVPYGGARLFESNVELRTELGKIKGMGLGGVAFLDGGDVTNTDAELDIGNLHWAAGAGLRLFTLIGAVRADFGYRLNRTGPGEPEPGSHYAFHLSIGEAY
jgi:outer membrane protein assembly factor BamA